MSNLAVTDEQSIGENIATLVTKSKAAFNQNLTLSVEKRVSLLNTLSNALKANSDQLILLADEETHLGLVRLKGEIARTCYQLEVFARYIFDAKHLRSVSEVTISSAPPLGRPAMQLTTVPLGPVAVFAASNFPFAFSVVGGDTAAALAAGCPVIVKSHPAHPLLSVEVFRIVQSIIFELGLPKDWISLVSDPSIASGAELVMHPELAAVSFTGSLRGGKALAELINRRTIPIPFFGELGSINPVIVLPEFLAEQAPDVANLLADSIVQGAGQFCTSPGLILVDDSDDADAFIAALAQRLDQCATHQMLTEAMQTQFDQLVATMAKTPGLRRVNEHRTSHFASNSGPIPVLHEVSLKTFLTYPELRDEIFGPYALVVRISTGIEGFIEALTACEGSLTLTVWAVENDRKHLKQLLPLAMQKAGRVLFSGVPTGVVVTEAQHHGGPWPASTRPESTSVGMRSIERFLRPVALQDMPIWLQQ
jgi:acyl-CoA reductase-like NAD-dependent aldehyde dehydrogenase